MVKKKQIEALHTAAGWNFEKVNRIINDVSDIFLKEKVTFIEELVVLSWFNAQTIHNIGKYGAKDFIEEIFLKQPQPKPSEAGIA